MSPRSGVRNLGRRECMTGAAHMTEAVVEDVAGLGVEGLDEFRRVVRRFCFQVGRTKLFGGLGNAPLHVECELGAGGSGLEGPALGVRLHVHEHEVIPPDDGVPKDVELALLEASQATLDVCRVGRTGVDWRAGADNGVKEKEDS